MKQIKIIEPELLFFSSDHHFGHENVIKHCNRPYDNVEEMDEDLISKWNEVVPKNGLVIHGGDLSMDLSYDVLKQKYLNRLNGRIIFQVIGNHDRKLEKWLYNNKTHNYPFGDKVLVIVKDPDSEYGRKKIIVNHFPELSWYHIHNDSWHMYGHTHNTLTHPNKHAVDITVDATAYYPISYKDIKNKILSI